MFFNEFSLGKLGQTGKIILIWLAAMAMYSCNDITKDDLLDQVNDANIAIPAEFNFNTTKTSNIHLNVKGPDGNPLRQVGISISIPDGNDSFIFVYKGFTNSQGVLKGQIDLSPEISEVLVHANYIGIPQYHVIPVEMLSNYTIDENAREPEGFYPEQLASRSNKNNLASKFKFLGTWNNKGVPSYKLPTRDIIPQSFLNDVNSSLPERRPVPTYSPEYLSTGVETNTIITKTADVWVTFVHEGAGYKNVLGYYTYHKDSVPSSTSDIDDLNIIFPNTSYNGSGGGLVSGDKVHIGRFNPGTVIGWFLISNGYNSSTNSVTTGRQIVFSNKNLNPESDPNKRQHNVMLYDETRDVVVLGFEDLNRQSGSDDDFNDAIFYVTTNPVDGVERGDFVSAKKAIDSDGDGVYDFDDDFPFDPTKTSSSLSPAGITQGSLCFEDSWPNMGDYDFNDLVIDYSYEFFTNAANQVTEIEATFNLQAIGASYKNGFGFQFNVSPADISSVTGCEYTEGIINLSNNGTEGGQNKATIIVFDNAHKHLSRPADAIYANTEAGATFVEPKTFTVRVVFQAPMSVQQLGKAPFNPFIFVNGIREKEIHLIDNAPTDLMDKALFGTSADISDENIGRYFQNEENMPWALHTPTTFTYPIESESIFDCYNFFENWAESEGRSYTNWYFDEPGFRVNNKLFMRQ
ncbi:MAG: LruC domain-containing protein [Bacteroidia bacterium]